MTGEPLRVIPAADLRPGDRVLMDHGVAILSCVTRPSIGGEAFMRVVFSPANRYGDTSLDFIPTTRYAVVGTPMCEVEAAWAAMTADQKRATIGSQS